MTTTPRTRRSAADRARSGRPVAERAFLQIRLVAAALLLVVGAGYRPSGPQDLAADVALPLAGAAALVLLAVALLTHRAGNAGPGRRSGLALVSTVTDTAVVLGVVYLAGLPPTSFALVLLMLPLLEAALWFGLSGLAALWTVCSMAAGAHVVLSPQDVSHDALGNLVVAMPTLLLATIPVAMLAEHLVAEVGQLGAAREAADDRVRLLGDLSAITAEIFPLDLDSVLVQLVAGAEQLGARGAAVVDSAPGVHRSRRATDRGTAGEEAGDPGHDGDGGDDEPATRLTRELALPGGRAYTFTASVAGPADEVARRVEALDLLVAQARVGLANAALVQQLETLKQTYELQATRDQLTGLLNRRGLVLRATQLPGHLSLLFCDLDGFKGVNDTLGHAAGDDLLEMVARRLEGALRADCVLGRMGGDEFVVVVRDAGADELAAIAARIEDELTRPFLLSAGTAHIGVSIGSAHAAPGDRDLDGLLAQADQLMYEVKRTRKAGAAGRRLPVR